MKILLASLIALSSISPAFADQRAGYSEDRTCYKTEYREEYVPGTLAVSYTHLTLPTKA